MSIGKFISFLLLIYSVNAFSQEKSSWGNWMKWGAQADGSYYNPVLPADFSDLDCIRVGNDYYAITSTFQYQPGMAVLHSKDLVNWDIIGHAVEDIRQIGQEMNWDRMNRYGRGIWAGSIRYHNGKFYVLFGTPDEGYFTTQAENPAGPWTPLINILQGAGWDDCSALWDDDGKAYFIGTSFKDRLYETYIFDMAPDCSSIDIGSKKLVYKGDGREASKLIKVGKWYYIIYSRTGSGSRYVVAKRSESMQGPWSEEKQITAPNIESNEPNQGGIIEGPDGKWYFFTHHGRGGWEGRSASLLPVTWIDGWPIPGNVGEDGLGYMMWSEKMPKQGQSKLEFFRDDFNNDSLNVNWEWNYYPRNEMWSLAERKGWLRLKAVKPLKDNDFKKIPNILTQRIYRTNDNEVTIKMDASKMEEGQTAGLCHYARTYAYIGICYIDGKTKIVLNENGESKTKEINSAKDIWLRSKWSLDGINKFSYSIDGKNFYDFGNPFQFTWGDYRGTRVGLFSFNNMEEKGYVDIDFVEYKMKCDTDAQVILKKTETVVSSPDGKQVFTFYQKMNPDSTLAMFYKVDFDGRPVILESKLDIQLDNHVWERALAKFWDQPKNWNDVMVLDRVERTSTDETWKPPFGERSTVKNHYNAATLRFARHDGSQYRMNIEVRAYDEGIAFRYYFPMHPNVIYHKITAENTEFSLPEGTTAWWAQWAQAPYYEKPLTDWEDNSERPLTLKINDKLWACLTEAQQIDYPQGLFKLSPVKKNTVQISLYGISDMVTPFGTPWRVIMAADHPGALLEHNDIILNLNDANKIPDSEWIKPGKIIRETTLTTKNALACIDFCAKHNMQYILFDWGWYGSGSNFNSDAGKVTAPNLNLPQVIAYGKEKGIGVWVYVNQHALQYQADRIFPLYKEWGLSGVKFGFVQFKTQGWSTWLYDLVKKAADNHLMVNIHDEYRPVGFSRTYPNLITQEGIRGNEEFPPATHNTILPFTRMIAGAADYTVCYFDRRIKNTHAHQLAFPVIFYSPLQTLYWYDRPDIIQEVPELEFFDKVPVTFDDTRVIHDRIGEYVTIARRSGDEWFVGTVGNDNVQHISTPLSFLDAGKKYLANIYTDDDNIPTPTKVKITSLIVDNKSTLNFRLKEKGGCAIHLLPANEKDLKTYKKHNDKTIY